MRHWTTFCAFVGLLVGGCYDGPPRDVAPPTSVPALGDPQAGLPSTEAAAGPAAGQPFDDSGGPVELDTIVLTAPAGWQRNAPSSSFVAAEFSLPRAEGDDADGRLTVSTAGGSVEANLERWKGQFDPLKEETPQENVDVGGMNVTIVDYSGDFNDARGPFAPPVLRADYRMIAAIVPVAGQLHFIKVTGPQQTIAAHADAIHTFIRSVRQK